MTEQPVCEAREPLTNYPCLLPARHTVHSNAKQGYVWQLLEAPDVTVEWGVRYDSGRIERCSEASAHLLASPGVSPVSRVVGAWQDTTPNPPVTKETRRA
ncbi:hypothetical protein [Amycolatopsis japonica]